MLRIGWQRKKVLWYYLFLLIPLAVIGIFTLFPVVWALYLSFVQYFPGAYTWVGVENYQYMLENTIFWKALKNTFYYTLFTVPFGLAISLCLSVLIFRLGKKAQVFFKSAFYLPAVTSAVVLSLVWTWIYQPNYGLLNYILSFVGLGPYQWLADVRLAMPSIIFMSLASSHGSGVILLTASMGSIPTDLYESAKLDGASRLKEFWYITLPLLKPTVLYLLIMGTIGSFQVFAQIYLMTEGGPAHATETMVHLIFRTAFDLFDFGQSSAMATVLFLIIAVVSMLQYRYLSTDVQY